MRPNENTVLIWIFHGGTCVTIAYVRIFRLLYIIQQESMTSVREFILTFYTRKEAEFDEIYE